MIGAPARVLLRPPSASLSVFYGTPEDPIDVGLARQQHMDYRHALGMTGSRLDVLAPDDDLPDCCFVEDPVVVSGRRALVTNMGAELRKCETVFLAEHLASLGYDVLYMPEGAHLEGGDVLRVGRHAFVGISARTNRLGFDVLATFLAEDGYESTPVPVEGCLHLKTAVTEAAADTVVLNPEWVEPAVFDALRIIEIDPDEPSGANVLRVGPHCFAPASAPRTQERLRNAGIDVVSLDISEFEKAGGGLTCLSIRLSA